MSETWPEERMDVIGANGPTGCHYREINPPASSLTYTQAIEIANVTGACADGVPCGVPPEAGDDAYCPECPNRPVAGHDRDEAGRKDDVEKPRMDLLLADMPRALEAIAQVLTHGASKYSPGNWQHVPDAQRRYLAAGARHELELAKGFAVDDESGEHHLAHAACCILFRLELQLREES